MNKKENKAIKKALGKILGLITLIGMIIFQTQTVLAEDLQNSKIVQGTQKLLTDATNWLMILAPAVAVLCIIYFLIRKSICDEMEHKKWDTRITVAIISCIGAVLSAVIINVLIGYFK
jgi:uncharacterized BrkB/YihY/UPF0761 family membrane protein